MAKKFISVLGVNDYKACKYSNKVEIVSTRFIQEALLDMYFKNYKEEDKIIIFLTKAAKEKNWITRKNKTQALSELINRVDLDEDKKQKIKEIVGKDIWEGKNEESTIIGLKDILSKKYSGIVNFIEIEDGKSDEDIWDTFEKIYESFDDGDEVIFDITHGFRSIPMQALTVLNYAKVLKKIKVLGIYYGAFEAINKETGIVPVFDLTSYNEILEWTSAINSFISYGNGNEVFDLYTQISELKRKNGDYSLSKSKLKNVVSGMRDFTNCIQTSRGRLFKEGSDKGKKKFQRCTHEAAMLIKDSLIKFKDENTKLIKPLFPLLNVINAKIEGFYVANNLTVGIETIKWCIDYRMVQQGYTAFEETMKTYLCMKYRFSEYGEALRDDVVKNALNSIKYKQGRIIDGNELNIFKNNKRTEKNPEDYFKKYTKVIETVPMEFVDLLKYSNSRNDISHFGFTADFLSYDNLNIKLNEAYKKFEQLIEKYKDTDFSKLNERQKAGE